MHAPACPDCHRKRYPVDVPVPFADFDHDPVDSDLNANAAPRSHRGGM
jgi:hypothetical protein